MTPLVAAVGGAEAAGVRLQAARARVALRAALLDPCSETRRPWFVAALGLVLAGDVFLMLPAARFLAGLASFSSLTSVT